MYSNIFVRNSYLKKYSYCYKMKNIYLNEKSINKNLIYT